VNLDKKGIDVDSFLCPICSEDVETVNRLFFSCDMAKDLWALLARWYCAHTINLVVRDGVEEHITSVDKIQNAMRYLRSSPGRLTSFEESAELQVIDPNNRSYFRNEVEDDSEDSTRSRKRRKMIEF
ncbi:RNA-directed DNA polymerase, eukaryota, partial [Tanacetum coccineum]